MLLSCNQSPQVESEEEPMAPHSQTGLYSLRDYTIPEKAIEQDAISLMEALYPTSLRSGGRKIAEVIPLTSENALRTTYGNYSRY